MQIYIFILKPPNFDLTKRNLSTIYYHLAYIHHQTLRYEVWPENPIHLYHSHHRHVYPLLPAKLLQSVQHVLQTMLDAHTTKGNKLLAPVSRHL